MKKSSRKWLITAITFLLIGSIIFATVMTILKWDFLKLSTNKFETNVYEITEQVNSITIETDTADISFMLAQDGKCKVDCFEEEKSKHLVNVQNNTLFISVDNQKSWFDNISVNFISPKVTIYLPQAEYDELSIKASTSDIEISKDVSFKSIDVSVSTGDVKCYTSTNELIKIKTTTGDICIKDVTSKQIELNVSTGDVEVIDVTCENFSSTGDTGDITLKNLIATQKFSIKRNTGDVSLVYCDASEIYIKTSTGDVKGTVLSGKNFIANSSTGDIRVPNTTNSGKCEITTSTGDIKIQLKRP